MNIFAVLYVIAVIVCFVIPCKDEDAKDADKFDRNTMD